MNWTAARESRQSDRSLEQLSPAELKRYFHPPAEVLLPRELRCLEQMRARVEQLLAEPHETEKQRLRAELQELAAALHNTRRDPVPRLDMLTTPFLAFGFLDKSIGGGERAANNVPASGAVQADVADPPGSMFWTGDRVIEQQDLFAGFDRTTPLDWSAVIWDYDGPKLSTGFSPGFEVRHGKTKAKLKFRETKSEPFTARLFHALGYHAEPTDYVRGLRVRYNPRLFREFNLRDEVMMHVRLIGPPVVSFNLQKWSDPLDFVHAAVLFDGTRLTGAELRKRLLPPGKLPVGSLPLYDRAFEATIDYLVLTPVNFQVETSDWKSVGRWDYGQLGHQDLRELRAAGLLAAWLGWFDCRFDNTSLRVSQRADHPEGLRACFSDLGAGLGRSGRGFGWSSENPNAFPWDFTRSPVDRGPGRMRTPFRVVRFQTIAGNPAFEAMTEADARWMARRIARLSREQLTAALIASGHDATETTLYLVKLIARRDKLVRDLGLEKDYGQLGRGFEPAKFAYDPLLDGLPGVNVGEAIIRPPVEDRVIAGGRMVPRPTVAPTALAADE